MANYNFKTDIKIGEDGEDIILKYLTSKGATLINKNKDNKYDVLIERKNKKISYEIKTDVYCSPKNDTGNIFIEFECRGKASGISVTEADWFVTYFLHLGEAWFIKTDELRKLIADSTFKVRENSGDKNSNTKGYLIRRKTIQKHFKIKKI